MKRMEFQEMRIQQMEQRELDATHRELAMLRRIQYLETEFCQTKTHNEELMKVQKAMLIENRYLQENLREHQKETRRLIDLLTTFSSREPTSTFTDVECNNKTIEAKGSYHISRVPVLRRQAKSANKLRSKRSTNAVVAFSTYLTSSVSNLAVNQVIKYDGILTNEGNAYNPHTGIFICPGDGLYLMTFVISSIQHCVWVALMVDGALVSNAVYRPDLEKLQEGQAGNAAILRLRLGQSVWVSVYKTEGTVELTSTTDYRHVTFSGVRLSDFSVTSS